MSHHQEPVKLLGILHWPRAFKPSIHLKNCIWNSGGISWSHCRPNFHSSWNKHLACIMKGAANPNGSNKREKKAEHYSFGKIQTRVKLHIGMWNSLERPTSTYPEPWWTPHPEPCQQSLAVTPQLPQNCWTPTWPMSWMPETWCQKLHESCRRSHLQNHNLTKNHPHTNSAGAQWQF